MNLKLSIHTHTLGSRKLVKGRCSRLSLQLQWEEVLHPGDRSSQSRWLSPSPAPALVTAPPWWSQGDSTCIRKSPSRAMSSPLGLCDITVNGSTTYTA